MEAKKQSNKPYEFIFKFIIIGDTGVGKSCILLQFIDDRFRLKHEPTIGVQFGAKNVTVKGKSVKLQIWDTAGQESFRSITRGYYRSAAGSILVYDISNRDSFDNIINWITQAKTSGNAEMSYLLVGNKCDLQMERKVSFEEGMNFAQQNNMSFLETSAKSGHNIEKTFEKVTEVLLDRIERKEIDLNTSPIGIKVGTTKHTFQSDIEVQKKKSSKNNSKCCN